MTFPYRSPHTRADEPQGVLRSQAVVDVVPTRVGMNRLPTRSRRWPSPHMGGNELYRKGPDELLMPTGYHPAAAVSPLLALLVQNCVLLSVSTCLYVTQHPS